MTIITSTPPAIELTLREFNCVKSILARKPKVRDGLDEQIDEHMAALDKAIGKFELDPVRDVRFGPANDAIIRDVGRLLGIYDSMCVPDTNIYTRAAASQAAAWNKLFNAQYKD